MVMRLTRVLNATVAILLAVGLPFAGRSAPVSAGGGDIIYDIQEGDIPYRVHVFTNTGTAMLTVSNGGFVECLVVGGGGGGGGRYMGGGGGAGGLISSNRIILAEDVYAVTVGSGGAGGTGQGVRGLNGGDSVFGSITATGGGGGGSWNTLPDGLSGGSGGGASGYGTAYGTASPAGQGNNGGAGATYGSGGGGGAGAAGGTGTAQNGGTGGIGVASSLSGVEVLYAGGGGGAAYQGTAGNGGLGGGGAGAPYKGVPTAGIPGTGGGGGGANGYDNINLAGAAGGSGIVMIRYAAGPMTPVPDVTLADAVTGSERFTNSNGVRIATFPAYSGYDQVQCTGENPSISALDLNGWVSTNAISSYYAEFDMPTTDTNITLYVWFSNTTDTAKSLLRSTGQIYYTSEPPVPIIRTTLTRGRLAGEPAIVTVEDIENGSTPGTADSIEMDLHARQVRTVNPAIDLTPGESYASIGAAGEYPVLLWLQNEAGNAAYSSVTCLVTVVDLDVSTNFWTGAGATKSWHDGANWIAGVPVAGQPAAITQAVDVVLGSPSAPLASFTMTAGTLTFTNWTTRLQAEKIDLQNGKLTLPPAFTDTEMSNRVWIVCSNLTVASSAMIDAVGAGYAGGDAAHKTGYGPGGGNGAYGGGYGGRGGQTYEGLHWGGSAYGSSNAPIQPGSGGGYGNSFGGAGGGAVIIDASGTVTIQGAIRADGLAGINRGAGGSGGAILINCLRLDGSPTGLLSASGANGQDTGGGGGGGRIAVIYDETAQVTRPGVRFSTGYGTGARGQGTGESGTVYLSGTKVFLAETLDNNLFADVRLFVDDFTTWAPDSVTVKNCSVVFANEQLTLDVANDIQVGAGGHLGFGPHAYLLCGGDLVLTNGGDLTVFAGPTNGLGATYGALVSVSGDMRVGSGSWVYPWSHETNGASVRFSVGNLTVLAGGGFDADQKGFAGGTTGEGYGPGGSPIKNAGAGYGGRGARHFSFAAEFGPIYGSIKTPLLPGSGGGGGVGGDGGGLIWIEAQGVVAVYGTLSANGGGRASDRGGGGSGGGIYIDCQRFEGDGGGLLSAAGGSNADTGGPGGGGRIAVHVDSTAQAGHQPGVRFKTSAGIPAGRIADTGGDGTVYLSDSAIFRAELLTNGLFEDAAVYADNLAFNEWAPNTLTVDNCRFFFGAKGFRLLVTNNVLLRNGADLGIPAHGLLHCDNLSVEKSATLSVFGGDTNETATYYGARVEVANHMQVASNAWVRPYAHPILGGSPVFRMQNLTIAAGGGFNADGTGYSGGLASGSTGYGPGGGLGQGEFGSGGGYGGRGGKETYGNNAGGVPYASSNAPASPGSGGGSVGGNGGGLILIEAVSRVVQNGLLSANGNAKMVNSSRAGGGSGGGIFVLCRRFEGGVNASMRADGGNGGTDRAGGGGGGRIAVWYGMTPALFPQAIAGQLRSHAVPGVTHNAYLGALSVTYGTGGGQNGESGTIGFFQAPPTGTLIILR